MDWHWHTETIIDELETTHESIQNLILGRNEILFIFYCDVRLLAKIPIQFVFGKLNKTHELK